MPLVPLIGMTTTLHIIMGIGWAAISAYACWISLGLLIYFTYGICLSHKSRNAYPHKHDTLDADSGVYDTDSLLDEKEDKW